MIHPTLGTLFFAGSDTDVGKTYTAALVVRLLHRSGRRVGVYKPAASGCQWVDGHLVSGDAVALWEAAGCPRTLDQVCPQCFLAPLAPPEAAAAEGRVVDIDLLRGGAQCWEEDGGTLIVEGVGGLLSPIAEGVLNIDLVKQFAEPILLIVVANRLGAIHQALATCAAAVHHGVEPQGVVLCDPKGNTDSSAISNAAQISRYCHVPILGTVPFGGDEEDVTFIWKLLN